MKTEEIAAESEKTPFSQRAAETEKGNLYREKTKCTEKTRNGQRKRPLTVRMLSETVLFSAKTRGGIAAAENGTFPLS